MTKKDQLFFIASDYFYSERYEDCISVCNELLKYEEEYFYRYYRASSFFSLGMYSEAIEDFTIFFYDCNDFLIKNGKMHYSTYYDQYAKCFIMTHQFENAIKAVDSGLMLDKEDASLYITRGSAYLAMGEFEKAIKDFQYCLVCSDIDGSHSQARNFIDILMNKTENTTKDKPSDNQQNNKANIEDSIKELNELTGLKRVKDEVNTVINLIKVKNMREKKGLQQAVLSLHLVFSGNPGTGKTTVARIIGKIYCALGILSKGHLVEVDRSGLVAGYVGQTAIKTSEVIEKAKGGILFIDEAYSLTENRDNSDYGNEAVDTLLKAMEDYRDDFIVIVAGYPEPMAKFLKSNPGLESRFNTFIHFEDYTSKELQEIFMGMCKKFNYKPTKEAEDYLQNYFRDVIRNKNDNFANAREVRNLFETTMKKQANRLALDNDITDDELLEIKVEDLE